jgi:hypothetical protein
MAKEWTFKCFKSSSGTNEIRKWLSALPERDQAKIDAVIRHLEIQKRLEEGPYIEPLTGYKGLFEIKVFSGRVRYRPIGCYGPNRREFTILKGAIEKDDKFEPKSAPDIADTRSKLINKEKHTIGYWTT